MLPLKDRSSLKMQPFSYRKIILSVISTYDIWYVCVCVLFDTDKN